MYGSDVYMEALMENAWTLLVCFLLLTAAAVGCFFCRDRGFYVAFAVMIGIGGMFAMFLAESSFTAAMVCTLAQAFLAAFVYVLLTCALIIRTLVLRARKRRIAPFRKVEHALPEKDNSYIRSRLKHALKIENSAFNKDMVPPNGKKTQETFHADYAKSMLSKLQNAPLTKAERLELQEFSALFSAYLKKNSWTAEEVRLMNDLFAYLLKLSAKYAV